MVESYSKNANHNMRRPVVKEEIVELMRQRQKQVTGSLKELETFARKENIPIIPHETVAYFRFLMETIQPKNILEIGTAIGFSALLMAEHAPDAKITTIDRNLEMIGFAKENFAQFDSRKQITLLEGDAVDVLSTLTETYDFVFMDSAKSKYIVFLPEILKHLEVGGEWSWMIFSKEEMLPRTSWKSAVVNEPFTVVCKDFSTQLWTIQV